MSVSNSPRHIAIIMDGNGRWAKQRLLPRTAGHKAGVEAVQRVVKACAEKKIKVLTLFAFSSENWRRPASEVNYLMGLFISALKREAKKLHEQNIRLYFIGDRSQLDEKLCQYMSYAENLTVNNTGLILVIAANYGGQWDLCEAMRKIAKEVEQGHLTSQQISNELIESKLATHNLPSPDLFIRTSGEQRISNFLLWQLAYSELYFSDVLWPDFNENELDKALEYYANRERRFGCISAQLKEDNHV